MLSPTIIKRHHWVCEKFGLVTGKHFLSLLSIDPTGYLCPQLPVSLFIPVDFLGPGSTLLPLPHHALFLVDVQASGE